MLVVALVHHSRLDYGNSVLTGIPAYLTPIAVNAAARLIYKLRSSDHITDALVSPLAADIRAHIEYKIALLTYKVMNRVTSCGTAISGTICLRQMVPDIAVPYCLCRRPAWPTGFAFCSHKSSDSTSC